MKISTREQEVLQLIAHEKTTAEIAMDLFLSSHTVLTHRKNLLSKLDVKNTAGLIRKSFELGFLSVNAN